MRPRLVIRLTAEVESLKRLTQMAQQAKESEEENQRRALYVEQGREEFSPISSPEAVHGRNQKLATLAEHLARRKEIENVRARDVIRMMEALVREGPQDDRIAELGRMAWILEQYGAIRRGRRLAPRAVILALLLARWNAIHNRPLTEGMDAILRFAYYGWLAFEAPVHGTDMREEALIEAMRLGARRGVELLGFIELSRGQLESARLAFEKAYEITGNVRLRNYGLALSMMEPDS
ncbi:MAG: hypothetical protein RMJ84_11860 [Sandaracinaceae bacterium]|nr:hypothetical protein [Sandaracinaceae bacterium]